MAAGSRLLLAPLGRLRVLMGDEIGRGTVVNLGFAVGNSALAVLTAVFAGNSLGPAGVGILSLGFLVLEFMGMIDNLPATGFMRDYAAGDAQTKLATFFRLKIALGVASAAGMALLAWPLSGWLDIPVELLLLLAVIPATAILSSLATTLHEARRQAWRRSTPGFLEGVVKLVLYAAFWALYGTGQNVVLFAQGAVLASLIGAAVGALLIPSWRLSPWDGALARRYLGFGAKAQVTGVLNKILFWGDILLIDLFLGHHDQGLYRTAYSVMAFVPLFASTVGTFLFPAISEAAHLGQPERVRALFGRSFEYVLIIALPLILLALLFALPVLAVFGPEFTQATWILQALAVVALIPALLVPFEALFPALDRPDIGVKIGVVMVVLNIGLDLLLIPRVGVAGAIAATALAFVVGLVMAMVYARRLGVLTWRARP